MKNLPVEIKDNELPVDDNKKEIFNEEKIKTSGGFTDIVFLAGIMVVCFLWGMLAVILK